MSGNSIGISFKLTTFGESHGPATGGVIDGCPAGLPIDPEFIKQELDRRKPFYEGATGRKEADAVEFLSGIGNGISLGTPIAFIIRNEDVITSDYQEIKDVFRPSHADYSYFMKYGRMATGGGRASGRETAARVAGGAVAKLLLGKAGISVKGKVQSIGDGTAEGISKAIEQGDTLGGTVTCRIAGVPAGLGEPVFDKLSAALAKAAMSIPSAKAFEYGLGFMAPTMPGSKYNDQMTVKDGKAVFLTHHDGGIQGGISNGDDIYFRVAFKPVPSVKIPQDTINKDFEPVRIEIGGRHDVCHVPRLVVVVESMAALVLADHWLRAMNSRLA